MPSSGVTIRFATVQDVPTILELLRDHAVFEKDLHNLEATEATLTQTITFGQPDSNPTSPSRPVRCLLLFTELGVVAGFSIFFYNYSSWRSRPGAFIEDLYVLQQYRSQGYGKMLLQEVARDVVKQGGGRIDWSVATWNEPSIQFYKKMGAKMVEGLVGMRVDREALEQLASL